MYQTADTSDGLMPFIFSISNYCNYKIYVKKQAVYHNLKIINLKSWKTYSVFKQTQVGISCIKMNN